MADIRDQMEMSETEDAESEYFQNVTTSFDDNLEESINSMQGSFALPTFAFGQSNELQGSQGFQFVALSGGSGGSDSSSTKSQSDRGEASRINNQLTLQALLLASQNSVIAPSNNQVPGEQGVQSAFSVNTSDNIYQGNINTLILQSSHFNLSHNSGEGVRSAPREILPNSVLSDMPVSVKQENEGQGNHGDSGEGASSDEKSGKSKSSPKRRSRKGRSTSSGAEMELKTEPVSQVFQKVEYSDQQHGSESGFRPSLEEILTEKKMALMKSPEVVKFLKEQQKLIAQEKKANRHTISDS